MAVATWNDSTITWDSSLADWNGNYSAVSTDTTFKSVDIARSTATSIAPVTATDIALTATATYRE